MSSAFIEAGQAWLTLIAAVSRSAIPAPVDMAIFALHLARPARSSARSLHHHNLQHACTRHALHKMPLFHGRSGSPPPLALALPVLAGAITMCAPTAISGTHFFDPRAVATRAVRAPVRFFGIPRSTS